MAAGRRFADLGCSTWRAASIASWTWRFEGGTAAADFVLRTRRIVDAAGRALPQGQAVDACLYNEPFDGGDAIGAGVPCLLEADGALVVAKDRTPWDLSTFETATDFEHRQRRPAASAEAVAILPDAKLWAFALTGATE